MDFLSVQPGLVFWSIVNFLFFLLALYLIGAKRFIGNITDRERIIQDAIDTAESQKNAIKMLVAENEQKIADSQKSLNEAMSKIITEAQQQAATIIENAKTDKTKIINDAVITIELNKQNAIKEIRTEVADLVVYATEKVLQEKLDADKDRTLIEKHIKQLSKN